MFEAVLGIGTMVAPALLAAWWLAGYLAGRLAFCRTQRRLRLGVWALLTVLGLAGLLSAAELFMVGQLGSYGWLFVEDRVILGLPPLVLPASAVLLLSAPRLWRVVRSTVVESKAPVDAASRSGLSDPLLVVPFQATAAGAALFAYLTWFPPGRPSVGTALTLWGLFVVSTAALWARQRRRHLKMGQPEVPTAPGLGFLLLRMGAFALVICVGFAAWFAYSMQASALPDRFSMMAHENADYGGGPEPGHGDHAHHSGHGSSVSLTELTGPREGEPDRRFTLTAQETRIRLSSGKTVEAWTFDGKAPGPELRARQGDLVEVTLVNEDIEDGVTLHWHGIDVPNAEDGVAGLTQNAVRPGERYTYRFRAEQTGTYWYHSHQVSSEQVRKGLFGAFIVEPHEQVDAREITVMAHSWENGDDRVATIGTSDTLERRTITPGTPVRLRLINTDSYPVTFSLTGAPFKVAAIDGTALNTPTNLTDTRLESAAGGRYDVTFTMPSKPVRLGVPGAMAFADENRNLGLLLSRDGKGEVPTLASGPEFDPVSYGKPEPTPFDASSDFDREFEVVLDNRFGFHDGLFYMLWTINGEVSPDTPMQMVREGDLVKTTFVNRSFMDHPMHLHGHHVLVLSRNGEPVNGSPWWADTLNVAPGESYEVAFRADNPGIWMNHCHNLDHAAQGMTMHLGYEGVTTPFEAGREPGNRPE
ncbi:MAG TPA: multicopper oxidase domain-containing protein [Actinomycetota bacterium]|nr:multicopper oxidase domain-containing protein [Actinomycetota bacterium]